VTDSVSRGQRFSRAHPCPVCGGCEGDARGQGKRCTGWLGVGGDYVHCSRDEHAGGLPAEDKSSPPTYLHLARGPCRCGVEHAPGGRRPRTSSGDIEATYDYVDEAGDLLFQVVRKTGKRFLQRKPDASKPGEWIWSLGGKGVTRRVLYRLPAILAADPSTLIFVVEGEKDVDTCTLHGLLATCSPHGAGKWGIIAKHGREVLKGRSCVVLADNDSPGIKHAKDVAKSLGCPWITMPEGKDVSEWLGAGGTAEGLVAMATRAREAMPPPPVAKVAAIKGDWARELLLKEGSTTLRPVAANVVTILTNEPVWQGVIAYDDFAECATTLRAPPWRPQDAPAKIVPGEWTEKDTTRAQNWLADKYQLDVGHETLHASVQLVADRQHVHPVRDWLSSLRWDAKRRLGTWLVDVFGCDDTPLTRAIGTSWLVSAVARIFAPGCQVDTVLVLEGNPGMKKSTVLRALFGDEYFFEMSVADIASKDSMQVLRCKWAGEFPEIDSLSRSEWGHVKSYITRRVDRYRESYGRKAGDYPRQVIFGASTNKDQWIGDETGGIDRRIWPVRVRRGDEDSVRLVKSIRAQLFAEARARYESGEAWHFVDPELVDAAREEQAARRRPDDWTPIVAAWLERPREVGRVEDIGVTTGDALMGACGIDVGKITQGDTMRMGAVLRTLGWVPGRQSRRHGAIVRLYRPGDHGEIDGPILHPGPGASGFVGFAGDPAGDATESKETLDSDSFPDIDRADGDDED
jgi:predicted P-loop ATPase